MSLFESIYASPFYQLAAILLMAGLLGFLAQRLRQPLIVAFIAVGLLTGPDMLGIVHHGNATIDTLAQLGVALLLFMVGLKLDLALVPTLGSGAVATGLGQVVFTAIIGFFICLALGMGSVPSLYVSIALTFSSTIIVVKLLSDKREIDTLHGRIALGFLIVQDIFVIFCMVALSAFGIGGEGGSLFTNLAMVLVKGVVFLALLYFFIAYIADPLAKLLANTPELMMIFSVAWAAALAAGSDFMGFSIELGGLLAGVSLASTSFRDVIASRLSSLRDFLLLFFFIALGAQINMDLLGRQVGPALALSAFILVGNPLIVMAIMGFMGYRKKTGFLAGLTVAQISEFSLIFVAMGITLGHVKENLLGLVTLVGLITIFLSTYMIMYSHALYKLFQPYLDVFERRQIKTSENIVIPKDPYNVLLFGLGRYGSEIAHHLCERGIRVLGLDSDPDVLRRAKGKKFDVSYGDVTDPNAAEYLPLDKAEWVICAVPHPRMTLQEQDIRMVLLESLKNRGFKGKVAMVSHSPEETRVLKKSGVDLVLMPFFDAASLAVSKIMNNQEA